MEPRYRRQHAPPPIHPPIARAEAAPPTVAGPLVARFLEEDDREYLVGELGGNRTAQVPKRRAMAEPSSPEERRRGASERLLRWSSYALVGIVAGGIVGIAIGIVVVLAALARLAAFSSRIRRWRYRHNRSGDRQALPAQASRERMLLLGALGQGFAAILLGSAVLFAIVELR